MAKKKTSKMRGSKTAGYGAKKKHRGKGSKAGSGHSGAKKQKKQMLLKQNPDYFVHKKLKKQNEICVINLRDLAEIKETKINLKEMGYDKLLGDGEVNRKLEILVDKASEQAKEKVEKAGGKVITGKAEAKID